MCKCLSVVVQNTNYMPRVEENYTDLLLYTTLMRGCLTNTTGVRFVNSTQVIQGWIQEHLLLFVIMILNTILCLLIYLNDMLCMINNIVIASNATK
jgi:hypothetical protein